MKETIVTSLISRESQERSKLLLLYFTLKCHEDLQFYENTKMMLSLSISSTGFMLYSLKILINLFWTIVQDKWERFLWGFSNIFGCTIAINDLQNRGIYTEGVYYEKVFKLSKENFFTAKYDHTWRICKYEDLQIILVRRLLDWSLVWASRQELDLSTFARQRQIHH